MDVQSHVIVSPDPSCFCYGMHRNTQLENVAVVEPHTNTDGTVHVEYIIWPTFRIGIEHIESTMSNSIHHILLREVPTTVFVKHFG